VNGPPERDKERARQLMMAGLDGELSADERAELTRLLEDDERLAGEWERFKRVQEVTESMRYREPPQEVWQDYWSAVYSRLERRLGWLLLTGGLTVLLGWAAWRWIDVMLHESTLPGYIRVAIFAVVFGMIVLLVSVVREKLFVRRRDPYREIQR
jgi:ferric-dicitrate binding protein FerR (iron transport regulator)